MNIHLPNHVRPLRQGDGWANEAGAMNVLALTDARSQASTRDVQERVSVANSRHLLADLAEMAASIAEDCQLHSLELRQVHGDRLDFRRFGTVQPRQSSVRNRARIFIEWRYSRCIASHGAGLHQHCAQSWLTKGKPSFSGGRP